MHVDNELGARAIDGALFEQPVEGVLHDVDPDALDLGRMPELLRDLIRYGHGERGLRPGLTDASLQAVDRWAPAFVAAVRTRDDWATA